MIKIVNTISWIAAIGIASSLAIVMPVFAQTNAGVGTHMQGEVQNGANGGEWHGGAMKGDRIFGTVSAVNGNTLTVNGTMRMMRWSPWKKGKVDASSSSTAQIVYTVDASNAKIYKGSATTTVTVADIAIGDTVVVQGTVSGTAVTAIVIRDGAFPRPTGRPVMSSGGRRFDRGASSTPAMQGNGEPVVGGNVTAISGTTLTITNASNVTYTINAASTTIIKNGTSSALSNIGVGDSLMVQGTINGTSVTASSIIDQGERSGNASSLSNASASKSHGIGGGFGGFFGAIGGFFRHLFGF